MQISTTKRPLQTSPLKAQAPQAATAEAQSGPSDSVTFGSSNSAMIGMGMATGAIGVGAPVAGLMGGIKIACTANSALGVAGGVALGLASAAIGTATVPMSLMGAAMSTDSGNESGANAYFLTALGTSVAAGAAIFLS
jgi:hypothetical protein